MVETYISVLKVIIALSKWTASKSPETITMIILIVVKMKAVSRQVKPRKKRKDLMSLKYRGNLLEKNLTNIKVSVRKINQEGTKRSLSLSNRLWTDELI